MKIKYNIIAIAAAFSLSACGDFLEPNSKSEFVPEDAVSLNELLLGEAYQRNDKTGFNIYMNLMDDDIEATAYQTPSSGFDANKYLATFTWQPDMYEMMDEAGAGHINIYERYYELILGCNAVLDYLPDVTDTQENINKVKAQAHALRGFYYFNLINIFAPPYNSNPDALGVPLKLTSGIEADDDYLKRKSVSEVYTQILSDLHTAEATYEALPEALQWEDNFRTNLPMVQLLLSRVYLYMENWEKAAKYAGLVMQNKNFSLVNLNNVATTIDGVRNYINYGAFSQEETIWPYGSVTDMFAWTYEYATTVNDATGERMHAYFGASQELLNTFSDSDLRKERYIVKASTGKTVNDEEELMYMAYGKVYIGTTYYLPKSASNSFGRSLRLSEAYLNYAEAKTMLGGSHLSDARNALNELRKKRFKPSDFAEITYTDSNELLEFVKAERRRELCFEGHRWYDLRRWGMPEITHVWYDDENTMSTYTLQAGDLLYTVPLPDEALELNSKLVQNELPAKRQGIVTTIND